MQGWWRRKAVTYATEAPCPWVKLCPTKLHAKNILTKTVLSRAQPRHQSSWVRPHEITCWHHQSLLSSCEVQIVASVQAHPCTTHVMFVHICYCLNSCDACVSSNIFHCSPETVRGSLLILVARGIANVTFSSWVVGCFRVCGSTPHVWNVACPDTEIGQHPARVC